MSSEPADDTPGIVQRVLLLFFVGGIIEPLGMLLYLQLSSPAALETLVSDGVTLDEVISFVLASPDRILVAAGLALLAFLFAWKADTGGGSPHHNVGGGF
jgi:hypothetical protein